jgi:hypothetical protein
MVWLHVNSVLLWFVMSVQVYLDRNPDDVVILVLLTFKPKPGASCVFIAWAGITGITKLFALSLYYD